MLYLYRLGKQVAFSWIYILNPDPTPITSCPHAVPGVSGGEFVGCTVYRCCRSGQGQKLRFFARARRSAILTAT